MASTVSPHALYGLYDLILKGDHRLKTGKNGGIVGDANHGSGYHLSRDTLKARGLSGDYSIQCAADKRGPGNTAAATDITFGSLDELITVHKRLRAACEKNDPRIAPIRETIGTLDGKNVSGYNRVATGSGTRSVLGWHPTGWSDKSHLWHIHLSWLRDTVEDTNAVKGVAELILGLAAGALGWVGASTAPAAADPAGSYPRPDDEVVYMTKVVVGQKDSDSVYWVQRALREAGFTKALKTGDYDANTVAAVKDFQTFLSDATTGQLTVGQTTRLRGLAKTNWSIEYEGMSDPVVKTPAKPVASPPVAKPPATPEVPTMKSGITEPFQFISFNAQWPEYGSVQTKVAQGKTKPWSSRKKTLADKIKASKAKALAVQELGQSQAAELAKELGGSWSYQRLVLNCVFWRNDYFTEFVKVRELTLPAYGQYPGRSYLEVWLKDKNGNRQRVGSSHLTVKTAHDDQYQLDQIEKITSFVNDEDDDWPLIIGVDTNNKQSDTAGMWARLKQYGFQWDRNGIDAILWNYGVKISRTDRFELGDGSDHDGRTAPVTTNKK